MPWLPPSKLDILGCFPFTFCFSPTELTSESSDSVSISDSLSLNCSWCLFSVCLMRCSLVEKYFVQWMHAKHLSLWIALCFFKPDLEKKLQSQLSHVNCLDEWHSVLCFFNTNLLLQEYVHSSQAKSPFSFSILWTFSLCLVRLILWAKVESHISQECIVATFSGISLNFIMFEHLCLCLLTFCLHVMTVSQIEHLKKNFRLTFSQHWIDLLWYLNFLLQLKQEYLYSLFSLLLSSWLIGFSGAWLWLGLTFGMRLGAVSGLCLGLLVGLRVVVMVELCLVRTYMLPSMTMFLWLIMSFLTPAVTSSVHISLLDMALSFPSPPSPSLAVLWLSVASGQGRLGISGVIVRVQADLLRWDLKALKSCWEAWVFLRTFLFRLGHILNTHFCLQELKDWNEKYPYTPALIKTFTRLDALVFGLSLDSKTWDFFFGGGRGIFLSLENFNILW